MFVPQTSRVRRKHIPVSKVNDADRNRVERMESRAARKFRRKYFSIVESLLGDDVISQVQELYKKGQIPAIVKMAEGRFEKIGDIYPEVVEDIGKNEAKALQRKFNRIVGKIEKVVLNPDADISFDPGDPASAAAMRQLQLNLIREIGNVQREVIREALASALDQGLGAQEASRLFKESIGLTSHQFGAVQNYRHLLVTQNSDALHRALRDRRFDSTVRTSIATGTPLSSTQIDRMVDRYKSRMIDMRAETIARTESLRSTNMARQAAIGQMQEQTGLEDNRIKRIWNATMDSRVRDTHAEMNGQERGKEEPFVSPAGFELMFPGDPAAPAAEVINCRCVLTLEIKDDEEAVQGATQSAGNFPLTDVNSVDDVMALGEDGVQNNLSIFKTAASQDFTFSAGKYSLDEIKQAGFFASQAEGLSTNIGFFGLDDVAAEYLAWHQGVKQFYKKVKTKVASQKVNNIEDAPPTKIAGTQLTDDVVAHPEGKYAVPKTPKDAPEGSGLPGSAFQIIAKDKPDNEGFQEHIAAARELFTEAKMEDVPVKLRNALFSYTGNDFERINKFFIDKSLRGGVAASQIRNVADIDAAFDAAAPFPRNLTVYRGVKRGAFQRFFPKLESGKAVVLDKAFMSASTWRRVAWNFSKENGRVGVVFEIRVPKGSRNAIPLSVISQFDSEFEVLIKRGSRFKVIQTGEDHYVLELLPEP